MVIFINQLRMKIGVMFGTPETTTGGNALEYYASVRLDIRKIEGIKESNPADKKEAKAKGKKGDEKIIGNVTKVKVVKNKVAPPFKTAYFDILFNYGISKNGELLDLGEKVGSVVKTGAWYAYNNVKIGQGRLNAMKWLEEHSDEAEALENTIREYFKQNNSYSDTIDLGEGSTTEDDVGETSSSAEDAFSDISDDDLVTPFPEDL